MNSRQQSLFRLAAIPSAIAVVLGSVSMSTYAQNEGKPSAGLNTDEVEVINVTGIRGSQIKSQDIKRSSSGVVDAISAEDIGKFPDTNLAESLQRITGVSIDRVNNEGSKVTVRGFGPEFNLVMLNNRQMPTAQVGAESTRSYDFANIASESVSGVEIYKTGKADISSGGIGATINIKTARPFDKAGFHSSVGVKAVTDRSVEQGDDWTPEISGLVSNTFADDTFGVGLSFAYQERDSTEKYANVDGWLSNPDHSASTGPIVDNNQNPYGNTWYARNMGFGQSENERTRTNGQLVLQWAPADNIEATLDYTYSKLELDSEITAWGQWLNGSAANFLGGEIDEHGTYVLAKETGGDYMARVANNSIENENKSLGFNLKWQVTDTLDLTFDAHSSNAKAEAVDNGSFSFMILGAAGASSDFTFDARGNEIPTLAMNWNDSSGLEASDYRPLFAMNNAGMNDTDVDQFQLSGTWVNDSNDSLTSIDFGIARTEFETTAKNYSNQFPTSWYGDSGEEFHGDMERVELGGNFLSDFSGGGSDILTPYYYRYDFGKVLATAGDKYGFDLADFGTPISNHSIEEKTDSAFIQLNFESEFNDMPLNVTAGFRYESTDVTSRSEERLAESMQWNGPNEWQTNFATDSSFSNDKGEYKVFLPNLDLSLEVVEDLYTRFSYSKTVTRSSLTAMRGTTSLTNSPKVGSRVGSKGNPDLDPYSSENLDVSIEYYYDDASYVSVGWFNKDVSNFIATVFDEGVTYDGIRDPYNGPRAQAARDALANDGIAATEENLVAKIREMEGLGATDPILQTPDDPLTEWQISQPNNVENLTMHGWEIAAQHWFWDTGFGVSANATFVSGDVDYDVESIEEQFALPGMSDSYNLSGFYDKDGLQARVAYNWRDDFLSALGQPEAGTEPQYTESYGQLDVSVSYDINDTVNVFVEGLNVLEQEQRIYGRYEEQLIKATQNSARYAVGVRAKF
ncbi:TonB-dependent receptor [Echinimonas agarilytica]|uniref:TonB-dependent receptor n=1 Tax=Echinimonas agarilytica TaxID=1215918 RepID=A0AA42B796_9GAMM|nr:TonB-dependent receptor [Echinimonas agarilytica]MCM2679376.1 TonB-dependent receptor [Echinimonas agarilytica]